MGDRGAVVELKQRTDECRITACLENFLCQTMNYNVIQCGGAFPKLNTPITLQNHKGIVSGRIVSVRARE